MKKILGICLIIVLSAGSAFAQGNRRDGQRMDPTERTEKMIRDLKLDDDRAAQLRKIETEHYERMSKDREEMMKDRENVTREEMDKRREEMRKRNDEKNERVKQILTDDQYKKYLKNQPQGGPRGDRRN